MHKLKQILKNTPLLGPILVWLNNDFRNHCRMLRQKLLNPLFVFYLRKALKANDHKNSYQQLVKLKKTVTILMDERSDSIIKTLPNLFSAKIVHEQANDVDCIVVWGTKARWEKISNLRYALKNNLPVFIGEDSFIRSREIAIKGGLGCGAILDNKGVYFSSYYNNCIDDFLNSDWQITDKQKAYAKETMQLIKDLKVSKYNVAEPADIKLPGKHKTKVLVLDQRKGDQSINGARANNQTFKDMINAAIAENPDADIIIKTHPDANSGKVSGYYVEYKVKHDNVYKYTENANPVSLLEKVDKVYCCSSGMGLEALLLGKQVTCYGSPFFSGWGLTTDRGYKRYRNKARSIEEVFYAAYIQNSYYISSKTFKTCDIQVLIKELSFI